MVNIVITLVAKNKECYSVDCEKLINILKINNLKNYKTKKLSSLAKDFYMIMNINIFYKIKNLLKKDIFIGSDLCIQENLFRKKKIIACDMDKTVISIETIDLIGEKILKNSQLSELTQKAMNGSVNFNKSIIERTKVLKGITVKEVQEITSNIKLTADVDKVIKTMNKNGCHTMLISGGFDIIANIIGKKIGFKEVISNKPTSKNGILTGELTDNIIDGKGKLNIFKNSTKLYNAKRKETLAVGDGQNDIEMIRFADLGISWKGFPNVNKAADAIANYNFKSILYFQGYSDDEIIY